MTTPSDSADITAPFDHVFGIPLTKGLYDVLAQRRKHASYGHTPEDDDARGIRPLVSTAIVYAHDFFNWCPVYPGKDHLPGGTADRARSQLVKAASVLLAAIDSLDRQIEEGVKSDE